MEGEQGFYNTEEQGRRERQQQAINGLQRALILMSDKPAREWIEANGARFRRLIERRPEFLDRFEEEGEAAAQEVKDLMFSEED